MSSMEFWGVEVKAGEPLKVEPKDFCMIHLSQAALGESKKGNESVPLFVKFDEKKLVLGTLSQENIPQLSFDLVFEKEFELSHNWKNGSVFFCGYQVIPDDDASDFSGDEEDFEFAKADIMKAATAKDKAAKPEKPKATLVEPSIDDSDEDDSDEDDSDEDGDTEEGMSLDEDSDDESDSEDEETPKKAETSKKRANDSATKTPVSSKKAKTATPQKTDAKKAGQVTPHPAKGKAAANGNSSKSPKSAGNFSCKSCDKAFVTDGALKSHSQAKHGAK
ncbi:hypothetical protein D5086_018774 [Populus alba]|uniref:Histone deacetylase HDT1-like n=3 Tax=Populus TaxID=3689 RepID=A0A4U5MC86_POPAL|nr:histone deacetylase HDT1-like [Populus alba]KAJ6985972.1 histone deacetylase HDT1-like [Populus alba x Populus x berolinensis]TKR66173.1 histone deacetylase HDT1-like [Populus alba]